MSCEMDERSIAVDDGRKDLYGCLRERLAWCEMDKRNTSIDDGRKDLYGCLRERLA